jgi:hypothetical protein
MLIEHMRKPLAADRASSNSIFVPPPTSLRPAAAGFRDPVGIRLLTRNGHDWAGRYPLVVEAVARTFGWVKTRGLCVMSRFARIFFILLVSAAESCSSEQIAQKQVERKDIRQQLASAYESCVRTSFASQLPTMVDRNMAIDQAFTVCQTEERKLQDVDGAISAYRNTLKEELLRR